MSTSDAPDPVTPTHRVRHLVDLAILPMTVAGLVIGLALTWAGNAEAADLAWTIPSVIIAVRLTWGILRDLAHGELGVDLIAILAIAGALLLHEPFAAAVIGVMLATGEALERYAQGRAQRELTALLGGRHAPSSDTRTAGSRRRRSRTSGPATCWRSGPAKWCPSMAWWRAGRRCSTSRRSPASRGWRRARTRARSPRARSMRARPSIFAPPRPRPTAPTPGSSAS